MFNKSVVIVIVIVIVCNMLHSHFLSHPNYSTIQNYMNHHHFLTGLKKKIVIISHIASYDGPGYMKWRIQDFISGGGGGLKKFCKSLGVSSRVC